MSESIDVAMPRLGDMMETGVITRWLKAEGEWVAKGEALFEVETDKIEVVVDSIGEGFLHQEAAVGDEVAVAAVVARLVLRR